MAAQVEIKPGGTTVVNMANAELADRAYGWIPGAMKYRTTPGMSRRRGTHANFMTRSHQPSWKNMWLVGTTPLNSRRIPPVLGQLWCCVQDIEPESDLVNGLEAMLYRPDHAQLYLKNYQRCPAELTVMKNANVTASVRPIGSPSEKNPPKPSVPEPTGQEMSYARTAPNTGMRRSRRVNRKVTWTGD